MRFLILIAAILICSDVFAQIGDDQRVCGTRNLVAQNEQQWRESDGTEDWSYSEWIRLPPFRRYVDIIYPNAVAAESEERNPEALFQLDLMYGNCPDTMYTFVRFRTDANTCKNVEWIFRYIVQTWSNVVDDFTDDYLNAEDCDNN